MYTIKSLKNKSITILLSLLIAVSLLLCVTVVGMRPSAETPKEDTVEFAPVSLGLSNTQFSTSSGNYPASPSSWTGEYVGGGKGDLIKGVIDLTPSVYSSDGNKKYKLDQYDEYSNETEIPKSIFGEDTQFGGDQKALFINTVKGAKTVYAYTSEEMTLVPNSFYRFSVWVKTGDFGAQSGATVKLNGLGQNFAFNNINTVMANRNNGDTALDKSNNYGWIKYSMYVRTSASLSKTVKLSLGLGDAVVGNDEDPDYSVRPASGYVFFDEVRAERISAFDFAAETMRFELVPGKTNVYSLGNALAIDLNETKSFTTKDGKEIGTFSQNVDEWKTNIYYDEQEDNHEYLGTAIISTYNSQARIKDFDASTNAYGFTKNPWAPYGRAEYSILDFGKDEQTGLEKSSEFFAGTQNADIMLITTYNGSEFTKAATGIASPFVTIERFKYYRFSVWVKDDSVDGEDGIVIVLKGKQIVNNKPAEYATALTEYANLTGDSEDKAHYGWKEQIIYIKGSALYDYDLSFELWLGVPHAFSSGIAMFDNATFTELKYSDYTAMSEADGGNIFTIDNVENSTGITNGNFVEIGDIDDESDKPFPLPVANWTYYTPDTVSTKGFSAKEVDTDNAYYGIIPIDRDTFSSKVSPAIPGIERPIVNDINTVLLLSSVTKTAFCYQSPSITLATDKANKIAVDMMVGGVDGYGASLVLKTTDGDVISTIENITTTNKQFRTFTFYVAAPRSEKTVYLEIWLGLNDRKNNTSKLSAGSIYVKQATINEWTAGDGSSVADEFNTLLEKYKFDIAHSSTRKSLDYGIYSFASPTIDYYDIYTYAQTGVGTLYQWNLSSANSNVKYGMFNVDDLKNDVYRGFSKKDLSGNMMYIFNTDYNYAKFTYDNTISLVSGSYFRIDIQVKVNVTDAIRNDKALIGAGLSLTGTSAAFKNIKDTTTVIDKTNEDSRDRETFKTYSFFISTGDDGGDIGLDITFGGDTRDSYIQGWLIIGDIKMTEIDNLEYEDAEKSSSDYVMTVKLSETQTTTDNSNTEAVSSEISTWVIPTVILSSLLIIGVLLIVVVKIRDHVKSKRKVAYSTEYDRSDVYNEIERLKAQQAAEVNRKQKAADIQAPDYDESPITTKSDEQADGEKEQEQEAQAEKPAPEPKSEPKSEPAPAKTDDKDLDD